MRSTTSLFLVSLLTACGVSPTVDPMRDATVMGDAMAVDAATAPDVSDVVVSTDVPVTSAEDVIAPAGIYEAILRPRCARCHGGDGGVLDPTMRDAEDAYRALVDVPTRTRWVSFCVEQRTPPIAMAWRVRPGDPSASLLAFLSECYIRDALHDVLTERERATLRAWILAGAPREGL